MGRHVVVPLERMGVVGLALAHQMVKHGVEVALHVGVGILVERQGRRGVLQKEVQQPRLGQLSELCGNLVGDEVHAPPPRPQREFNLAYHRSEGC